MPMCKTCVALRLHALGLPAMTSAETVSVLRPVILKTATVIGTYMVVSSPGGIIQPADGKVLKFRNFKMPVEFLSVVICPLRSFLIGLLRLQAARCQVVVSAIHFTRAQAF